MLFVCGLFDFGFVLRETKTQLAYKQAKIERKNKTKKIKKVLTNEKLIKKSQQFQMFF